MNLPLRRFRLGSPAGGAPSGSGGDRPPRSWWEILKPPHPRDLIGHNPLLKLISVLLAVFVWYTINESERDAERVLEMPIVIRKLERGLVVTNPPVKPVSVILRGPRTILDRIEEHRARLALELTGFAPGEARVELNAQMVRPELPRRLKVVRVEPARVKLHLERVVRRTIPVKADLVGMPAFGYTVVESQVDPPQVEVTGPQSKLDELKEITTDGIDLRGESDANLQRSVLLAWAGDFVSFSPDQVTVTIKLEEVMMSRDFRRVGVSVLNADGAKAEPGWVDLSLRGPQRVLHNFRLDEGAVYVDAAGLAPGSHRLDVRVDVPPALEVVRKAPDNQIVRIGGAR